MQFAVPFMYLLDSVEVANEQMTDDAERQQGKA